MNGNFNFHPRCRKLNSVYICFADDLLMYCRADLISVKLLNKAFMRFSKASCLQANLDKSSLYIAGVADHTKEELFKELGYASGVLPFRYLGVLLASKKLSANQYLPLIEKITAKVTCWSVKLLSYGRVQLIKSVLFGVIEKIYRTFLWTSFVIVSKKALVSWETICKPHAAGGLNIMDLCLWNRAAILKQLWNIARSKECLWIQWVHTYFIRRQHIETIQIPKSASWVILQGQVSHGALNNAFAITQLGDKYSTHMMYEGLMPQYPKVHWKGITLHPSIHLSFKFIVWLAIHKKLATVDRLVKFGIQIPRECAYCGLTDESFSHLYFDCQITKDLWRRLCVWLGYPRVIQDWETEV
ncbi:hypothetical protein R3W88_000841 [Solanum pinnatisectum]|uniref:Reverse transcriptase zinc-binding domain-containing protein n=1 Tax=Solanum pinnatisectum TaxID=50273 RepID=A0AAV9MJ70_9SOLN|nr:hypothetical protein R3W88_000841 [Solanum pinnatisectum]